MYAAPGCSERSLHHGRVWRSKHLGCMDEYSVFQPRFGRPFLRISCLILRFCVHQDQIPKPPAAIRETRDPDILKDDVLYEHDQMLW
jgi:hypothetical protein